MPRGASGAPSPGALVVTGGGRGIGAQIAVRAARNDTPVALTCRSRPENAARVVGEIEAAGGQAMATQADAGSDADVTAAFTAVDAAVGPVSGLVNNAVLPGPPRRLAELPASELDEVFRTTVSGAFPCSRDAARRLSTRNGGSGGIVTLSSAHAVSTGAPGNRVHLAVGKAALETMSRGLARELAADGIRVNIVRPGVIATETRPASPKTTSAGHSDRFRWPGWAPPKKSPRPYCGCCPKTRPTSPARHSTSPEGYNHPDTDRKAR